MEVGLKRFYLSQVLYHKWFVIVAGLRVGNFPLWRLIVHDWSKFLPAEFRLYRRRFTGKTFTKDEWNIAWLHHIHLNPHHYEHWILNGNPLPMPDLFIREMVIDWLAAGRGYLGSWDIQEWLNAKYQKIQLHPETLEKVKPLLESQGFHWPQE